MAGTATPVYPQTITAYGVSIANSDGTSTKTVATGGSNGTKIEALMVSSTDTSDRDINVCLNISSTGYMVTTIKIPAGAGNSNAVPNVDVLRHAQLKGLPYDGAANPYLYLSSGTVLGVAATGAVTSGKTITVTAVGADF